MAHKPQQGGSDLIMHAEWFATLAGPFVNLKNVVKFLQAPTFNMASVYYKLAVPFAQGKPTFRILEILRYRCHVVIAGFQMIV